MRIDGRQNYDLRKCHIEPHVSDYAEGSVYIEMGKTKVLCTASISEQIPKWLQDGSQRGWVTAEYGMLPRSTHLRKKRDQFFQEGRSREISRVISRSLRSCINLQLLQERQIYVDCDVLQADGSTRTTSITGAFLALAFAIKRLMEEGALKTNPLLFYMAAVSVGYNKNREILLDLNYEEDSQTDMDMNFILNSQREIAEIQGGAEGKCLPRQTLSSMLDMAEWGCHQLFQTQFSFLKDWFPLNSSWKPPQYPNKINNP